MRHDVCLSGRWAEGWAEAAREANGCISRVWGGRNTAAAPEAAPPPREWVLWQGGGGGADRIASKRNSCST